MSCFFPSVARGVLLGGWGAGGVVVCRRLAEGLPAAGAAAAPGGLGYRDKGNDM